MFQVALTLLGSSSFVYCQIAVHINTQAAE
jgi:hypothetical protein